MLNIQKYENEILSEYREISCDYMTDCDVYLLLYTIASKHNKEVHSRWSLKSLLDWFLQEYKEPILDDVEREYLSNIVKPFRKNITYIKKGIYSCSYEDIGIVYKSNEYCTTVIELPPFKAGTMYKGMKAEKEYTLKELGL